MPPSAHQCDRGRRRHVRGEDAASEAGHCRQRRERRLQAIGRRRPRWSRGDTQAVWPAPGGRSNRTQAGGRRSQGGAGGIGAYSGGSLSAGAPDHSSWRPLPLRDLPRRGARGLEGSRLVGELSRDAAMLVLKLINDPCPLRLRAMLSSFLSGRGDLTDASSSPNCHGSRPNTFRSIRSGCARAPHTSRWSLPPLALSRCCAHPPEQAFWFALNHFVEPHRQAWVSEGRVEDWAQVRNHNLHRLRPVVVPVKRGRGRPRRVPV